MKYENKWVTLESFTFLCFTGVIFVIDLVTPKDISISILYTIPVCGSLFLGRNSKIIKLITIASILFLLISIPLSLGRLSWIDYINRGISCILIIVTFFLCRIFKRGFTRKVQFEDRFLAALDSTSNAMILVDMKGSIILANQAASDIFGYDKDEFISMKIEKLIPEEYRKRHVNFRESYQKNPHKRMMGVGNELFGKTKLGKLIPVEIALNPINSNGESFVMTAVVDISMRKETLLKLKTQNEKLEKSQKGTINLLKDFKKANFEKKNTLKLLEEICEHAAYGLISTDISGVITSFNKAAEKMLGYNESELKYKESILLFHDESELSARCKEFSLKLNQELKPGLETIFCHSDLGLINQFEWDYVHKDGIKFPVLLSITALYDSSGKKTGYLKIAQDIRVIKETERKLRESNEELEKFAYITSHDLKAPIRGIGNLANSIKEDLDNVLNLDKNFEVKEKVEKNFKRISTQVLRMQNLIKGILDYSKIGTISSPFDTIDLKNIIDDIIIDQTTGNSFKINNNVQSIKLNTELIKLSQVISNIISNSIKYHDKPDSGKIEINSKRIGSKIEISIKDNGPGIDPKYHKKIFEIFQTLQSKDHFESTGVGLALIKKIIYSKNCKLELESDIGKGANFIFTWPIDEKFNRYE